MDDEVFKEKEETEHITWPELELIGLRLECVKQAVLTGSNHTEQILLKAKILFTYITTGN